MVLFVGFLNEGEYYFLNKIKVEKSQDIRDFILTEILCEALLIDQCNLYKLFKSEMREWCIASFEPPNLLGMLFYQTYRSQTFTDEDNICIFDLDTHEFMYRVDGQVEKFHIQHGWKHFDSDELTWVKINFIESCFPDDIDLLYRILKANRNQELINVVNYMIQTKITFDNDLMTKMTRVYYKWKDLDLDAFAELGCDFNIFLDTRKTETKNIESVKMLSESDRRSSHDVHLSMLSESDQRSSHDVHLSMLSEPRRRQIKDSEWLHIIGQYNELSQGHPLDEYKGDTKINYAAKKCYLSLVRELIQKIPVDVLNDDSLGCTLFARAVSSGRNSRMAHMLLEYGLDPFVEIDEDIYPNSPIEWLVYYSLQPEFAELVNYVASKVEQEIHDFGMYGQLPKDIRDLVREYLHYEL